MVDTETGEFVQRRLEHESGEARGFYAGLKGAVRVGIEATGHTQWFEAMLSEFGHELWMGDAAKIRAAVVRKQKTDARDAAHLLDMLCSERFPKIWRPALAERDLRQLLWHRQKLVWMRGAVKIDLEARQPDDAFVVGGSRAHGSAPGPATETHVPTFEVPSWGSGGESRHCP